MEQAKQYNNLALYLRIISYLKPYYRKIILVFVCNFFFVIFSTLSVWMVAPVITALFSSDQPVAEQTRTDVEKPPEKSVSFWNLNAWMKQNTAGWFQNNDRLETLKYLCMFIFLTFFLKNMFAFLEFYFVSFIEQRVIRDLRLQLYEHILKQPMAFFNGNEIGALISRVTNDINAVNVAVNRGFTKIIRDPVLILLYLLLLFSISWQLTLIALTILPLTSILIQTVGRSLKRKSKRVQERISDITRFLQESLSGIKVVKAFAMESHEGKRFEDLTESHYKAVLRQVRLNRLSRPFSETVGVAVMVSVIWFGGRLVLEGELLSSEDFIRFIVFLFTLMEPLKSISALNNNIQIALASGQRIFELMDTEVGIADRPNAIDKATFDDRVEYKDVTFRYGESSELVLQDINLTIHKNEKVAFVGSSGGGKTTIVNLLPRFYDVVEGAISIDGADIRDIKQSDIRQMMGIVTQEVFLFNESIASNIAYGHENFPREKVEAAAKLANAYDFIMDFPDGFDTIVGERGVLLSGGQRQRISIARAILKNPPILIFDEATSALDSESEFLIQEAIENLMKDRTVLMIAHRLSSIIHSDKIIVLEDGRITDIGKHDELLKRSKRYKHLYELQFQTGNADE
ncbi:MAG: ABC transporter ATP-binding protein [Calditrichia bacterium]